MFRSSRPRRLRPECRVSAKTVAPHSFPGIPSERFGPPSNAALRFKELLPPVTARSPLRGSKGDLRSHAGHTIGNSCHKRSESVSVPFIGIGRSSGEAYLPTCPQRSVRSRTLLENSPRSFSFQRTSSTFGPPSTGRGVRRPAGFFTCVSATHAPLQSKRRVHQNVSVTLASRRHRGRAFDRAEAIRV